MIKRCGILFEIADRCNLCCVHCYQSRAKSSQLLSLEKIDRILEILAENEYLDVTFTGYEPLTNPELFDIIGKARNRHFFVNLKTNGYLLSPDAISRLKELHIGTVTMTLFSTDPVQHDARAGVPGAHRKVMDGITQLQLAGIRVILAAPLLHPLPDIDALAALEKQLDVQMVFDYGIFSSFDRREEVEQVKLNAEETETALKAEQCLDEKKHNDRWYFYPKDECFLCYIGDPGTVNIDCAGNLYACGKMNTPLGHMLTDDFAGMLNAAATLREKIRHNRKCNTCELFPFCNPCPAEALQETGSINGCSSVRRQLAEVKRKLHIARYGNAVEKPLIGKTDDAELCSY